MFLDSKLRATRFPVSQCLSLLTAIVGLQVASTLPALGQQFRQPGGIIVQQPIVQQPIVQQPRFQPQNQIFQNQQPPVYQNPTYFPNQGYQNQNQNIQPATPVYRAPPGGSQSVPPVARRIQQPTRPSQPQQPTAQQILDAEEAAYNAEKLVLVEQLLEKYKTSAVENQRVALEKLETLTRENDELRKRMGEFNQTNQSYQTQIREMEKELSAAGKPDSAKLQEAQQLKTNNQQLANQVRNLDAEVQSLSDDNKNYRDQITNLKAAQEQTMNLRPAENNQLESNESELTEKNQQLARDNGELQQANRRLSQDYTTLKGQYQQLSQQQQLAIAENQKLSDRITNLKVTNNNFETAKPAVVSSITANAPAEVVAEPEFDTSPYDTKISQLTRKNRQLSEINSDFKDENRSLSRELASLKGQSVEETTDVRGSTLVSTSLPVVPAAVTPAIDKGGWGILTWLIPFLAIGLGIAFFVIIKEELHRKPSNATIGPKRQD